jgi:TrmH family RNA methyltransferase
MKPPLRLTSTANPRVKRVVALRSQRDRAATGLFIAEGWREVERAIGAGLVVEEVFLCPQLLGGGVGADWLGRGALGALGGEMAFYEVTGAVFGKMAYLREPQGVLAVVRQPRWSLEELGAVEAGTLYLVAVGTEKPGNLGAMVRTADAAGCQGVLAAGTPVDPFNPNAIRSSTGAVFAVPTVCAPEGRVIEYLKASGIRVVAATPAGAVAHTEADLTGALAIAIGPEDRGLSEAWLEAADATGGVRVAIAMRGRVIDSLNASAAAAVLLFEAARQRGMV